MTQSTINQQIKELMKLYSIRPQQSKGQNFLLDVSVVQRMVEYAQLTKTDTVVEVGPGLGVLTEALVAHAGTTVAIELDEHVIPLLQDKFAAEITEGMLSVYQNDILRTNLQELGIGESDSYKIVANIPYNITSRLIKHFLTHEHKPSTMVLMVQREVAQRICAQPGELSLLAISVQLYGKPVIEEEVPRTAFVPVPNVDSAVLHISGIVSPQVLEEAELNEKDFWRIVRMGFAAKRKTIANTLSAGLHVSAKELQPIISDLTIDPKLRPQQLTIDQWISLAKKLKKYSNV